jgi:hypothetical protein
MERTWRPMEGLWDRKRKIARAVRKVKAETLFGVGIKLSVIEGPDERDIVEAAADTLQSIGALTGFDFIAASGAYVE